MWPHLSVHGGEQLFVLSLLSSLPQSAVLAEPPSPPPPCPASAPGLGPAGASTDWQEETPLLLLSSRGCLGLQPQSPVLSCARCGMVQVLGMLKGEVWLLFHGSASGVSGVLQEPRRLVPKAGGRRLGFPSVLCRGYSS